MNEKVKEFEKHVIDAVSVLRDLLGAKSVNVSVHVDNYEKGCKTDLTFFTSIAADATQRPGCKVD